MDSNLDFRAQRAAAAAKTKANKGGPVIEVQVFNQVYGYDTRLTSIVQGRSR